MAEEEDVLRTGSNELAFPVVVEMNLPNCGKKIPTGSRDGEPYNGYHVAEDYSLKLKVQQEKAEKARIAKEKKIARDAQIRKEKAEAKKMKKAKNGSGVRIRKIGKMEGRKSLPSFFYARFQNFLILVIFGAAADFTMSDPLFQKLTFLIAAGTASNF